MINILNTMTKYELHSKYNDKLHSKYYDDKLHSKYNNINDELHSKYNNKMINYILNIIIK